MKNIEKLISEARKELNTIEREYKEKQKNQKIVCIFSKGELDLIITTIERLFYLRGEILEDEYPEVILRAKIREIISEFE